MDNKIEMRRISDLKPYKNNPRKNDKAVDAVAASIKAFGFKQPVVIDDNGEIIAGHTRVKAAKKAGYHEVPCIIASDLTPEQVKAYRLANNKVGGDHPTMKPIPLLAYPIMNSSMSNAIVLDPFGGSGSTLIACEQTDRICRTIELDEKFCDVIVKRYIEQVGSADGVSVQRDGLTYRYDEVALESSMA